MVLMLMKQPRSSFLARNMDILGRVELSFFGEGEIVELWR